LQEATNKRRLNKKDMKNSFIILLLCAIFCVVMSSQSRRNLRAEVDVDVEIEVEIWVNNAYAANADEGGEEVINAEDAEN